MAAFTFPESGAGGCLSPGESKTGLGGAGMSESGQSAGHTPVTPRLSKAEALELAAGPDVHTTARRALALRKQLHGMRAYYVYNQHINHTNICINACRFCAFSKRLGDRGAYTQSIGQIEALVSSRLDEPITEIHIVGGLNPALPLDYYLELIRRIKVLRPEATVKAFTAVEVAFLAETYGKGVTDILAMLRDAGLGALPGGGAEVFDPVLRQELCPEKLSGAKWLEVHAAAHAMGIPTNATMLFGHIETWRERLDHLEALRDLQDATGGFMCFIPLPYQPGNNPLGGRGPDGLDYLKTMAVSRLFLDNIPHLKAYWVFAGIKSAQVALWAGADDFDGTIVEERIGHAAGATSPKGLTVQELRRSIEAAGFFPVERNALFDTVVSGHQGADPD